MATLADGVAYDPARRTWRRLPRPPLPLRYVGTNQWVLWTGRELLAGGVEAGSGGGTRAGAYDPATNRWRLLPRSPRLTGGPGHPQPRTAMWAGTRLLVWVFWSPTARTANNPSAAAARPEAEPEGIDLWAYDPAGPRWTPIAPPPRSRGANLDRVTLEWTGSAVVEPGHAVYDPAADRWLPLPAEPDQATPPLFAQSPARALLRVRTHADGAVQVYVLEPDRPATLRRADPVPEVGAGQEHGPRGRQITPRWPADARQPVDLLRGAAAAVVSPSGGVSRDVIPADWRKPAVAR